MSEQSFQIKIVSIDNSQFEFTVTSEMSVLELKNMIFSQHQIPVERQRLLHKGKLLKNPQTLQSYSIAQGSLIQIVAYIERPPEEESLTEVIRYALEFIPNNYISNRRNRERRREIDINEKLESIKQNLHTLENLMSSNRNFFRGQWVDVKDTVDQWLEAQIVDIRQGSNGPQAYIHYNGWPNRWDEWIDVNSPRIQYFKTHTYQSLASPMHSPHPINLTEIIESLRNSAPIDVNECILQALGLLNEIQAL